LIYQQATIVGALVALAYITTIGSILWWMLHVPKVGDVEQEVRRVIRVHSRSSRIVVPVQGDVISDRIVALASQMAKFRGAAMDVLYVIEVPLTHPINAEMSDQERMAQTAFLRAAKIADRYDVKITRRIERARQAGPGIVQYVRQNNADLLLIGDVPRSGRGGTRFGRSVEYVFENAPCEVIIDRPQPD